MAAKPLFPRQIAQLCQGFSLLLHAGVNTGEGAHWLSQEAPAEQKQLLSQIGRQLEEGMALSDALTDSGVFPHHVCALVRAGEASGRLEEALSSLAEYYTQRGRMTARLKSAVAYPSMLFVLMLAVIGVLLVKVLPVFDEVYASLGGGLTGIARGLLRLGQGLQLALPALTVILAAACLVGAAIALIAPLREGALRYLRAAFGDRWLLRQLNNARFSQVLAMGLRSGLPMEDTLALAGDMLADIPAAKARCLACIRALEAGRELPQALAESGFVSPSQSRLFALGLRGGSGEQVIASIALQQQEDAQEAIDAAMAKVEPAMVLIGSALVGFILLAVMLPLLNILASIG